MIITDSDRHDSPETLRARLADAEDMLRAIRKGEIDALVVEGDGGNQIYTLHSAEEPYRNLVEQMQEGAVVLTALGHILYSNCPLCRPRRRTTRVGGGQPRRPLRQCTRQSRFRRAAFGRQRTMPKPADRIGVWRIRSELVADDDGFTGWWSSEFDRDGSQRDSDSQSKPAHARSARTARRTTS